MVICERSDCFAYCFGRCTALEDAETGDCSFYKTSKEVAKERYACQQKLLLKGRKDLVWYYQDSNKKLYLNKESRE